MGDAESRGLGAVEKTSPRRTLDTAETDDGVCAHGDSPLVTPIDTPFAIKDPYGYRRARTPSDPRGDRDADDFPADKFFPPPG